MSEETHLLLLGYFLLTTLLLARLRSSAPARVVSTASDAHKFSGGMLDFDDLQSKKRYTTFGAYGRSKLCNILFTRELARRESGNGITANCFHPGMVGSDFAKNNGRVASIAMALLTPFARSNAKGAETGVYLCTSADVANETGRYYFDMKPHEPAAFANTPGAAEKLWQVSEALVGASR